MFGDIVVHFIPTVATVAIPVFALPVDFKVLQGSGLSTVATVTIAVFELLVDFQVLQGSDFSALVNLATARSALAVSSRCWYSE